MLTKKQNLMEVMKGGNPDRFVNQYEFMEIIMEMPMLKGVFLEPGTEGKNAWGVYYKWPEGHIGQMPVHGEHTVIKDITEWKKYVKAPSVKFSDEEWAAAVEHANKVDRNDQFVTAPYFGGMFEMCHNLMGMENALIAFYEEPELMHELIEFITEYELAYAKEVIDHIRPDAIFHHDDWGTQRNSFLSPEMFKEFFVEPYKKVYGFYKDNGVELIVHHCDSYAANLVPYMIEMGIDIWQGCMTTNNIPELIKQYGGQITFMGGIDSGVVDFPGWNQEIVEREVEKACQNGKLYFIPSLTQGLNISSFPGVYEAVSEAIDRMSKKMF
ncbi:MAG: uroporphyrinogen decarboxylase family protein [Thermacetogeniaceae bacterium]|jgi:uroporphyrinogen-III decarboxylase|nr:uroporphyrinogen decarboxylase [Syntrophomonadaceae bacterium]